MEGKFVVSIESQQTGGNCVADVIRLASGEVVVISDEGIGAYSASDWDGDEGVVVEYGRFMHSVEGVERREDSEHYFVRSLETYEPKGPVSVDLLTLHDGRVVGIDADSCVLYDQPHHGKRDDQPFGAPIDSVELRHAPDDEEGSVAECVSKDWLDVLDREVAGIPADSVVGACVVKACAAADALFASAGDDGGFEESRGAIVDAVARQIRVWYYG